MPREEAIVRGKDLIRELATICSDLADADILDLLGDGGLDDLFNAILDPRTVAKYPSVAEFFFQNKHRAALMAGIRNAITHNLSIKMPKDGTTAFVSPYYIQWFDDGVMLLEGKEPFAGIIGLYRHGQMSYAMTLKDGKLGDQFGLSDFEFVGLEDTKRYFEKLKAPTAEGLEVPLAVLRANLATKCGEEARYQELLAEHPWVLGLQYSKLQRHGSLDDRNIPDFTGVRVSDGYRDIFEIKPPTMDVFRDDGEFSAPFNAAWNQAERYLHFAREEQDYLQRKGFRFDNPRCFLICGYDLPPELVKKVRVKEKMNPAIHLMTYNDLLAFMDSAVRFIRQVVPAGE
jgi:hypothetical protein